MQPSAPDFYSIGNPFIELQSVDSTNNYAMAQVHAGLAFPGTAFFTYEQFAGKGQRGKAWETKAGENILMSVVLQPAKLTISEQFLLSTCIALSCFDLLNKYLPGEIFIKWPNDIYIRDRKTGGILIENHISGENWKYAIVGTGININQLTFDEKLPNPTSLKQATWKNFDVVALAKELCMHMEKRCNSTSKTRFIEEYNSHLYKRNEKVKLKNGDASFLTTIKQVTSKGKLITVDEKERSFDFGEVEWVK
jgi:BirA family transcriptional regulator, biotin operon repressor / biotin---[acetyl-CoA-carboxylase] ligase